MYSVLVFNMYSCVRFLCVACVVFFCVVCMQYFVCSEYMHSVFVSSMYMCSVCVWVCVYSVYVCVCACTCMHACALTEAGRLWGVSPCLCIVDAGSLAHCCWHCCAFGDFHISTFHASGSAWIMDRCAKNLLLTWILGIWTQVNGLYAQSHISSARLSYTETACLFPGRPDLK